MVCSTGGGTGRVRTTSINQTSRKKIPSISQQRAPENGLEVPPQIPTVEEADNQRGLFSFRFSEWGKVRHTDDGVVHGASDELDYVTIVQVQRYKRGRMESMVSLRRVAGRRAGHARWTLLVMR